MQFRCQFWKLVFLKKNPWGVHPVGWNRVWLEKSGLVEPHNGVGSPGQSCWLRKLLVGPPPPQNPLWVLKKCLAGKVYEAGSPGVRLGIGHKNFV